ncbi:MAG: hypothetical protein H7Y18_05720 [Clostridiaceae bacterium]|nr:hypothetical protein [Clostridiaceae bacterium]
MTKTDPSLEGLSKQKPFDKDETQPDMKGDKVWHSRANKTQHNKPKPEK